jgi:hypothetical protein
VSSTSSDVEPWELHSELVFVSPEVCERALELLPERDPYAFLARPRTPVAVPPVAGDEPEVTRGLPTLVALYGLWRIAQTLRAGLFAAGFVIAVALLIQLFH